jgi:hypothetical protein
MKTNNTDFAVYSALACGFACSCKNDFWIMPFIIIYVVLFLKPLKRNVLLKSLAAFCMFPIAGLAVLLFQGWHFGDFVVQAEFLNKFLTTKSFIMYSRLQGMFPSYEAFRKCLQDFFCRTLPLFVSLFVIYKAAFWLKTKFSKARFLIAGICFIFSVCLIFFLPSFELFTFLPMLTLTIILIEFRKLDKPVLILLVIALCGVLKGFFCLISMQGGSIYGIPLLLAALVIYILSGNKKLYAFLTFLLCVLALSSFIFHTTVRGARAKVYGINADYLYTWRSWAPPLQELINYIENNTGKTDRVWFYPEGSMLNYFTNRYVDPRYYMLHEHFTEAVGVENVIKHIRQEKIEYIGFVQGFDTPCFQADKHDRSLFARFIDEDYILIRSFNDDAANAIHLFKLRSKP